MDLTPSLPQNSPKRTAEPYMHQRSLPPTWGRIGGGVDNESLCGADPGPGGRSPGDREPRAHGEADRGGRGVAWPRASGAELRSGKVDGPADPGPPGRLRAGDRLPPAPSPGRVESPGPALRPGPLGRALPRPRRRPGRARLFGAPGLEHRAHPLARPAGPGAALRPRRAGARVGRPHREAAGRPRPEPPGPARADRGIVSGPKEPAARA